MLDMQLLNEVLKMSDQAKDKFSKGLTLFTNGMPIEKAMSQSGFTEAVKAERKRKAPWQHNKIL